MPTVIYLYPFACSPSSKLANYLFKNTTSQHRCSITQSQPKGLGKNYLQVLQGEDFCGNTTSFPSSPGEYWTLLVAKVTALLSFRDCHHFPRNGTLAPASLHSGNHAVLSVLPFVRFCSYCLVTATSPSVLVRLLHNSPSTADRASNQQLLLQC